MRGPATWAHRSSVMDHISLLKPQNCVAEARRSTLIGNSCQVVRSAVWQATREASSAARRSGMGNAKYRERIRRTHVPEHSCTPPRPRISALDSAWCRIRWKQNHKFHSRSLGHCSGYINIVQRHGIIGQWSRDQEQSRVGPWSRQRHETRLERTPRHCLSISTRREKIDNTTRIAPYP